MAPSDALRDVVQQKLEKMAWLLDSCSTCRVVFDRASAGRTGRTVSASIELHGMANGSKVFVQANHVDAASAAREAFDRATRKASHAPVGSGRRTRVIPGEGSGLHVIARRA